VHRHKIGIGIIGTGDRGCFTLGARIVELAPDTGMNVVALCDRNADRMREAGEFLVAHAQTRGTPLDPPRLYADYRELIADPAVSVILITTHTDAHREPAIAALDSGKKVYLDKPISVTEDDARAIVEAEKRTGNRLIMGFTRRYESSWREAHRIVESGAIGNVQMMQIRSLIPYTRYLQMWHRRSARSGGALNDKSSHHLDVFRWIASAPCQRIHAVGGRSGIFAPDPTAPTHCAVCDRVCPYRRGPNETWNKEGSQVLGYRSWAEAHRERDRADTCVYLPGADIEDHAMVMLEFANGVKASLFWAIFGPPAPDQETLEVLGSKGRLVLTRSTGRIVLYTDYGRRSEEIDARGPDFESSHYGADLELVRTLRRFVDGASPPAGASDGYESLRMILAARQSMESGRAVDLDGEAGR
jgi:predicted dehydrogenase